MTLDEVVKLRISLREADRNELGSPTAVLHALVFEVVDGFMGLW